MVSRKDEMLRYTGPSWSRLVSNRSSMTCSLIYRVDNRDNVQRGQSRSSPARSFLLAVYESRRHDVLASPIANEVPGYRDRASAALYKSRAATLPCPGCRGSRIMVHPCGTW